MFCNTCILLCDFFIFKLLGLGLLQSKDLFIFIIFGLGLKFEIDQAFQPSTHSCPPNMIHKDKKRMKVRFRVYICLSPKNSAQNAP